MSITPTAHGTHQVRWRDIQGRQRSRSFKTRALAEKFERQVRSAGPDPIETAADPLWKRMLKAGT